MGQLANGAKWQSMPNFSDGKTTREQAKKQLEEYAASRQFKPDGKTNTSQFVCNANPATPIELRYDEFGSVKTASYTMDRRDASKRVAGERLVARVRFDIKTGHKRVYAPLCCFGVWIGDRGFAPKVYEWGIMQPDEFLNAYGIKETACKNVAQVLVAVMEYFPNAMWKPSDKNAIAWPSEYYIAYQHTMNDDGKRQFVTTETGNQVKWSDEEYKRNGMALLRKLGQLHREGIAVEDLCAEKLALVMSDDRTELDFRFLGLTDFDVLPAKQRKIDQKNDIQSFFKMLPSHMERVFFVHGTDLLTPEALAAYNGNV